MTAERDERSDIYDEEEPHRFGKRTKNEKRPAGRCRFDPLKTCYEAGVAGRMMDLPLRSISCAFWASPSFW